MHKPFMDNDFVSNDKQREMLFPKSNVIHNGNKSQSLLCCKNENKTERHSSEGHKKNGSKSVSPSSREEGEPDIMDCVHSQKSGQDDFNFTENGWIDLCLAKAGIKEFATLSDEQAGLVALLIWVGYVYGVKKADTDFDKFTMVFNIHKILDAINPKSTSIENNLISENTNYEPILADERVAKVGKKIRSNNSFSLGKKVSDSYGDFKCSWFRRRDRQSVKEMADLIQDTAEAPQAFAHFFKIHDLQKRGCQFEADDNNHEEYLSYVNYVNVMG
ncbi:MAG: hypothetical protein GY821_17615 [Gammaproteobacteria bacterium]|nr:hypothetical protein [Gammaproteobacteria bacterium]